jgi:two-component sensor histidine kinase
MLFAHAFDGPGLLGQIRRFRQHPVRVYGIALGVVTAATLARLAVHPQLSTSSPFTTYGLAVICLALAGGFWPGMATLTLSLIAGSILFLPPAFSFSLAEGAGWPMLMFALVGSVNVAVVSGMMASILVHDAHQQLLFRELQHRSRNLFAVIQAVVSRTVAESQTLPEAKRAAETRLAALARTHAMLADSGWTGTRLDRVVTQELTSFASQVSCTGCEVMLSTPEAQNFALIIHELTTNAVKYGALSCPQGHVAINGEIDSRRAENHFRFRWQETGGPAVAVPVRKGFGSSILNGLAKRFAQSLEVSWRPEGLIYELRIDLAAIQTGEGKSVIDAASHAAKTRGAGLFTSTRLLRSAKA